MMHYHPMVVFLDNILLVHIIPSYQKVEVQCWKGQSAQNERTLILPHHVQ
jgi:hypothetical protein